MIIYSKMLIMHKYEVKKILGILCSFENSLTGYSTEVY